MKRLTLAPGVALPIEAVTQTFAILGKRGSGKTTTATVFVEELLHAGQQVVLVDPLDVTWGLRSSRDGQGKGFPMTVLGGDHADLPLEATAGAVLAEFVVEQHASLILSLRHFSLNDQRRFMTDFAEKLYALKGKQANRSALHLVIDEVDEFAHQRIPHGHERLFGAIDRLVRRGRASGIGVTMISQRPAVIHKDILSQAEVLICHQTVSPQDRKALEAWVEAHDAHGQRKTFMETLATLAQGEAWVWSPGWLDLFTRVQVRDRHTFDSSATPTQIAAVNPTLVRVDLDALQVRMAETIERAKADDPKELKKQIAALQRQVKQAPPPAPSAAPEPVVTQEDRDLIKHTATSIHQRLADVFVKLDEVHGDYAVLKRVADALLSADQGTLRVVRPPAPPREKPRENGGPPPAGDASLGKCERAILAALVNQPGGATAGRLTLLTRYRYSGGFKNSLAKLRTLGYMEGENTGVLVATERGVRAAGPVDPLPTGRELGAYWLQHPSLGKCERAILAALLEQAHGLTADRLCQVTGYEYSGGFKNALANLRTAGVLVGKNTEVMRASEELF